ncbi:acetylajmalan esterase-like isoform X2 [Rhododendron vialii]|uniref:acetylajmalan esterase-like isoform X2 n=1 Tax=Rhododendron vialii TaxID=182163 RepID=UPI00265E8AFE|nr:acetylajmalan esterase-like isoform X2 [Rhododendron vialii]
MATPPPILSLLLVLISSILFLLRLSSGQSLKSCGFDRIYQLGDSLSDTGNLIREVPIGIATPYASLPYGETFFKRATGRCSNGLLMIDYFAISAGLPFLNPYKNIGSDFGHGVNFAVAGATALPVEFLASKLIFPLLTESSLRVQLDWMSGHFNSICSTERDCGEKLKKSLFIVGEIGGNDFNYALVEGKNIEEVKSLVPDAVKAITDARAISYGADRVIVAGNWPFGCFPIYLTVFQTGNPTAYDKNQCLKQLNDLSMYFNDQLRNAIHELKKEFPDASIAYGDYYNAFLQLLNNASALGFDVTSTRKSCCGIGGPYDFTLTLLCGFPGVPVCSQPNRYIHWDGIHLTQEAYRLMAGWLVDDILPNLGCNV